MPDLNYSNEEVRKEVKAAAEKWLELGVDGFRLDAAMHIFGDNENKHIEDQLAENLNGGMSLRFPVKKSIQTFISLEKHGRETRRLPSMPSRSTRSSISPLRKP